MSGTAFPYESRDTRASEILNAADEAIAAIDSGLHLLFLNQEAERRLGRRLAEVAGAPLPDIVPGPAKRDLAEHCRETIARRRTSRFEQQIDGRVYEFEIRPTLSGGAAIWFREITEWKQKEENLRASRELLQLLVENVTDYAMFTLDSQGRITSWNVGAERILGFSESEAVGASAFRIFTPEDRANAVPEMEMSKALAEGRAEDERWHLRKDGSRFYASGILTPLWNEHGELLGFSKILRDFTERRKTEDAVLQAQKLESIGVLAAGVAHDFNNLLAVILGNVTLVIDDLDPASPQHRFLEAAIEASERAHRLTDQLLAYAGKGGFWKRQVDVSEVVAGMSDLLRAVAPKKTRLEFRLARGLETVEADPAQIQQLVTNLVTNAAEAIGEEKRGTVTVRTEALRCDRESIARRFPGSKALPGKYVSIEVEDSGAGMDEHVKARIFDPFFSTKFTGRGLGLAAVSGIVRALGGAVHVESEPGKGSRFTVLLPVRKHSEPAAAAEPAPAAAQGTVLLIDDEPLVRDAASRILARHGFEVLVAATGDAAVELLKDNRQKVGLALVDSRMPDISGHELVPRLRAVREDLRVIVASGYPESETRGLFEGQIIAGFIQKPYTSAELAETVKRAIASGE